MPEQNPAGVNPWLVAIAVMSSTFMEVLDTTVVNVSLPHIAGSLSARPAGFARNSLQTPGLVSADFRVLKYFPFGGVRRLDVVAEFFNIFNHPNVSQVNPVFGSGGTPLRDFGKPVEIINARQIQFSLDFEF